MSGISDQTQDSYGSGSPSDSSNEITYSAPRLQSFASMSSISKRLDYATPTGMSNITPQGGVSQFSRVSTTTSSSISTTQSHIQTSPSKKISKRMLIEGTILLLSIACILLALQFFYREQQKSADTRSTDSATNNTHHSMLGAEDHHFNIEVLFDPVQVSYIQSYEESAVGKYYYWDLLAEEYFKLIRSQLIKIIWMEEDVIKSFFRSKFNEKESEIIRKKVWKLREKSDDISIDFNLNNKRIWRYKHCFCTDPAADRSTLNINI